LAIVSGAPERDSDYIDKLIGHHPTHREKMAIRRPEDGGKVSRTFYKVLERFQGYALILCEPKTGRTHQIRVHLTHIGCPIVADKLYSGRDKLTLGDLIGPEAPDADRVLIARQALHAHRLSLIHPKAEEPMELVSPVPEDMQAVLHALREHRAIG
jgi:23S rRNA pseudouridine1911/1915/1917 synthase